MARGVSARREGSNAEAFRLLVRTTLVMVGVPALVMLLLYSLVLDRLFTFDSGPDKMVWAGEGLARPLAMSSDG